MDKIWLEDELKECESVRPEIEKIVRSLKMSEKDYNDIIEALESNYRSTRSVMSFLDLKYMAYCGNDEDEDESFLKDYENFQKLIKDLKLEDLIYKYKEKYFLDNYLNMSMEFDGDILITDPCYIMRAEHHGTIPITKDDWNTCNCGFDMEKLGINHYMTRDTLYGDWGCTTYNLDTKEKIGNFCADAGLVSVFLLDEVLKYNPDYDWYVTKPYTATVIKDFKGTVEFAVKYQDGYYEDETEYHKKGEHWEEYYLEVIGHGVNKVTGEAINFVGKQTGL